MELSTVNITATNIQDLNVENLDETKVNLANRIMSVVYPRFHDEHQNKIKEFKKLKSELLKKKELVKESKQELEDIVSQINKAKKVKHLLQLIDILNKTGYISGSLKNETIILMKVAENLSDEKLNHHINEIKSMIKKLKD